MIIGILFASFAAFTAVGHWPNPVILLGQKHDLLQFNSILRLCQVILHSIFSPSDRLLTLFWQKEGKHPDHVLRIPRYRIMSAFKLSDLSAADSGFPIVRREEVFSKPSLSVSQVSLNTFSPSFCLLSDSLRVQPDFGEAFFLPALPAKTRSARVNQIQIPNEVRMTGIKTNYSSADPDLTWHDDAGATVHTHLLSDTSVSPAALLLQKRDLRLVTDSTSDATPVFTFRSSSAS